MRLIITLVAIAFSVNVATLSAAGQGRGNGQAKKPQTTQVTRTKAETPKGASQAAKQTAKADARTTRSAAKVEARTAKADAKAARKTGTAPTTTTAANTTTTATTTTAPTEITPTTPTTTSVKNPKLEARLLGMLPPGTTVQDAMAGFKNWGQFVAAVHVSNNLNIPFVDLKARMTGLTPGPTPGTTVQGTPMSLGQAIQTLKGTTSTTSGTPLTATTIQTEVKKAEDAANTDLRGTRERS